MYYCPKNLKVSPTTSNKFKTTLSVICRGVIERVHSWREVSGVSIKTFVIYKQTSNKLSKRPIRIQELTNASVG